MPGLMPDEGLYRKIEQTRSKCLRTASPTGGSPRIGISANYNDILGSCLSRAYSDAVIQAGGTPFILPLTDDEAVIETYLDSIDGLLVSGGGDIYPYYLSEDAKQHLGEVCPERDRYDLELIRLAARRNIPIFGICRGHQLLAAAFGGTIYQDIYSQYQTSSSVLGHNPKLPKQQYAHRILLDKRPDSLLSRLLYPQGELWVNSLHHQAVKSVPPKFTETAVALDGINEAMEAYPEKAIFSVQWHPEQMIYGGVDKERQSSLFTHLIEEADLYRRARTIHRHVAVVDSHVDTPMHFEKSPRFDLDTDCLVDLPKMQAGHVDAVLMAAYLPQGDLSDSDFSKVEQNATRLLEGIHALSRLAPDKLCIARAPIDILRAKRRGRKAIMPVIENGYAIGNDLSLLRKYKELGVAYITLCHNGDNQLCDSSSRSCQTHKGLSSLGRYAIAEMNRLGIAIDVSHAADSTISQVLECSKAPILASHSSVRALADHPRNLPDELIRAIAQKGGVIQVCLYPGFLNKEADKATLFDAVDHIEYIIELVGIEAVGIGSDFDGGTDLPGCRNEADLIRITIELLRRGHSTAELKAILGGNLLRLISEVQSIGYKLMPNDL
ncbi:hypothetical protein HQ45_09170 [Porphyromonas crevioricanis]|uniref:Gamma-glutamyl-gamma-aminobutyrate hydrolase PuuD n=3 Tax=Porphyromonas crevioricanis TaxID=393921 RepID=A0A0A2FFM7_9PORP|nr:gamma-glutamyl-gamma-aminobutyrate hydrolase family protein [Porphyromonas crevioricanis]KGN88840.1 hypothetical protein HQ45_09170 [Porphyromonas crevioricanis]KGN95916.1 hypothetical protein HQ38_02870 [Porphyromonas crevioricanis]SJZ72256.1 Zn-dependent dipeptidase, dipeptidase homolog [Porphyromonas crevioricanis]SQH73532.1 Gamma-glutamyl-gamma-aminobutyrate hydrolase PuuD [Porphyromonas crevioricanis]GAD06149.1 glutamine amidotransferase, class I [Porphyromonas crevioricanis JCM 15906]